MLKSIKGFSADRTVVFWLLIWFAINVIQAAFTGLVNDEGYYHIYAETLAWGYFDHPPAIAILVWIGEALFGNTELGLRFGIIILQPLYLYLFWKTIRSDESTQREAMTYIVTTASLLMMQAYGFVAVPDAPLMMTSVVFLWAYKRFLEGQRWSWLLVAVAMAAMAYSKYQGALVVAFAVAMTPKVLLNPRFYLSGVVALVLYAPHLLWQYNNDFPSFSYHLADRNRPFEIHNLVEFVLNLLVVFNIFYLPLWVQAYRKVRSRTPYERVLKWMPILFILFFGASALRGATQPQWMIVGSFGLIWILCRYLSDHPRSRKYAIRMGCVLIGLVALTRLEMIFNPLNLKIEIFGNREYYGAIHEVAEGRPVIFRGNYAGAAKYKFYTGGEAYCMPSVGYRTHQWQYVDDSKFRGREVLLNVSVPSDVAHSDTAKYRSVKKLKRGEAQFEIYPNYTPLKEVCVTALEPLPERVKAGEKVTLTLTLENPYPYDITTNESDIQLVMLFRGFIDGKRVSRRELLITGVEIKSQSDKEITVVYTLPDDLKVGYYKVGFALLSNKMEGWFSATPQDVEVVAPAL
ncbi:MAG: glycosyltransferase family 39 protein [Rikenellaceae bacterium]